MNENGIKIKDLPPEEMECLVAFYRGKVAALHEVIQNLTSSDDPPVEYKINLGKD